MKMQNAGIKEFDLNHIIKTIDADIFQKENILV
jgi:hypothetical protein